MANTIFGLLDKAEQDIRSSSSSPQGTLRINAPMSFGILNPKIDIEATLDERVVNIVEEGFDVAIRVRRLEDSSLRAKNLVLARMVVCAAPAYLDKRSAPQQTSDLESHDCLVYDHLARHGVWSFERDGAQVDVRVRGRLRGNNGDILLQAAVDGLGVFLAPTFIAPEALRSGALVPILCAWRAA
jgi:DNA-binding transcriptional LysR family regulator